MAFMGATLGMFARVLFPAADPEMGLPLLIRDVLPVGVTGLVLAAYFAAIMSTADSCLLASVGNLVDDIVGRARRARGLGAQRCCALSRVLTLVVGFGSVSFALVRAAGDRLDPARLLVHGGGALLPDPRRAVLAPRQRRRRVLEHPVGGGTTVVLTLLDLDMPLDPVFYGLGVSGTVVLTFSLWFPKRQT